MSSGDGGEVESQARAVTMPRHGGTVVVSGVCVGGRVQERREPATGRASTNVLCCLSMHSTTTMVNQAVLYVHLGIGSYVCTEWNFGRLVPWRSSPTSAGLNALSGCVPSFSSEKRSSSPIYILEVCDLELGLQLICAGEFLQGIGS